MKTYNKKSNARRAAESLAKKFPGFTAGDSFDAGEGNWFPNMIAPKSVVAAGVPEELAAAAMVNGAPVGAPESSEPDRVEETTTTAPTNEPHAGATDDTLDALLAAYPEHAEILQRAFDLGSATRKPRKATGKRSGPTKREIAAGLLTRTGGCTAREILDVTGWPAVSVPALAKASGLVLTKTKDGGVTRYTARAA